MQRTSAQVIEELIVVLRNSLSEAECDALRETLVCLVKLGRAEQLLQMKKDVLAAVGKP